MPNKLTGLFYGWRMVAATCALRVLGAGLHSFGFTVFFLPLSQDLNLNRGLKEAGWFYEPKKKIQTLLAMLLGARGGQNSSQLSGGLLPSSGSVTFLRM